MRLSASELQIMEIFWRLDKPLSSVDIVELSPADKVWKDKSIYILIQALEKKNAIKEIGAVKGEKGKYLRLFEPAVSREEYYSKPFQSSYESSKIPMLFSALIDKADISMDTIKELESILEKRKTELK